LGACLVFLRLDGGCGHVRLIWLLLLRLHRCRHLVLWPPLCGRGIEYNSSPGSIQSSLESSGLLELLLDLNLHQRPPSSSEITSELCHAENEVVVSNLHPEHYRFLGTIGYRSSMSWHPLEEAATLRISS